MPLCGKSPDLLWLAKQGCDVTGVELSEIAARAFFVEANIRFDIRKVGSFTYFSGLDQKVTIVCGDYFQFTGKPFDALYDRASLVALPPHIRPDYIQHTKRLLKTDAVVLLIALEYDQSKAGGPPFSVGPDEVKSYWVGIRRAGSKSDKKNCPPKFQDAGVNELIETVWVTG